MKNYFLKLSIPTLFLVLGFFILAENVLAAESYDNMPSECLVSYDPETRYISDEKLWFDGERFRFSFTVDQNFCTHWLRDGDYINLSLLGIRADVFYYFETVYYGNNPTVGFLTDLQDLTSLENERYFLWRAGQRYDAYLVSDEIYHKFSDSVVHDYNYFLRYWFATDTDFTISWIRTRDLYYGHPFDPNLADFISNAPVKTYMDYNYSPEPEDPDPVIIIPGILGSWKVKGEWKIDPILGTYNNLIEALISAGYRESLVWEDDPNLFTFPYDWRVDNNITAQKLKDKIQEVKDITGSDKVDIVAHSMGGLVSRYYIQSDEYQNDVDQIIFLGTPHNGSPESYPKWEAGYLGGGFKDYIYEIIFTTEAISNFYLNLTDYIKDKVPTVGQLLPIFDYLKDGEIIRNYDGNYPKNSFLENLNSDSQLELLNQRVAVTNFVGDIASSTLRYIRVVDDPIINDNNWFYGYPENLDENEDAFELANGDGTVPIESANLLGVDKQFVNSHNDLPTIAQQDVIELLTGTRPDDYFDNEFIYNISRWSVFRVYSPVDFVVIDPLGRRVGKDFENNDIFNEIEGSFYTGFDDHIEFVLIPNPIDGEYRVELQGVDSGGEYTLVTSFVDEDNPELNQELEVKNFIADEKIDIFNINYNSQNPEQTVIESNISFDILLEMIDDFYNSNGIIKKSAYNFLKNNLKQTAKKYDKILVEQKGKYNITKQLEKIVEKIDFYYQKNWIGERAKNILTSNINLLIKKI